MLFARGSAKGADARRQTMKELTNSSGSVLDTAPVLRVFFKSCGMTGQCCMGGAASRRSARRLSRAAASILPGAALVLLPKCPLCLAAWLTAATGIGFSAAGATWGRGMLMLFAVAAVVLAITPIVRCTLARYPTVVG